MRSPLRSFSHVTVGVADLDAALRLWADRFGFEVTARSAHDSASQARLWDLSADAITRQALLYQSGHSLGGLHLVEFREPASPVRQGVEVFDRLPKNIDIYVRDLPAQYAQLCSEGFEFRAPWVEMPGPDGLVFREVQLPAHDDINISMLEVLDTDYDHTAQGFAGIGPVVMIVEDANLESTFFTQALGLEPILQDLLAGPDTEALVGLPPGAGLDYRVLGDPMEPLGRTEVIEYQQTHGRDLYSRAHPPALGLLHLTWRTSDLTPLMDRLDQANVSVTDHGTLELLYGTGRVISFRSPAGLRIEVIDTSQPGD